MIRISTLSLSLLVIILIGPMIDLLTGYFLGALGLQGQYSEFVLTPGVLYRGLFLTPLFLFLTHLVKSPLRLFIYGLVAVFLLGSSVRLMSVPGADLVRDFQRFSKLLFPILGFGALLFIGQRYAKNEMVPLYWTVGALYGAITAVGILGTFSLGLSLKVYRGVSFASAGLIDSQNSAGLILIITLPLVLYYIYTFKKNNIILALLAQAIWLYGAFRLSTRAVLIGVPLTTSLYQIYLVASRKYNRNSIQLLSWLVVVALTVVLGFFVVRAWASQDVTFIVDKFGLLVEGDFRNRVPLGIEKITGFTFTEHLFGQGDGGFATTENDIVDVYGKFGLLTLLLLLFFLGYFYFRLLSSFLRQRRLSTFVLLLSFTFYILHAAVAGHALLSSPVNNVFLLIYYLGFLEVTRTQTVAVPERKRRGRQVQPVTARQPTVP